MPGVPDTGAGQRAEPHVRLRPPVSRPLTDLLAVTYGPLPVLNDLLAGVEGITQAFIYGSWAARYLGSRARSRAT